MRYRGGLRSLIVAGLVVVARVAAADDVDREIGAVPGTFGDPLYALELSPSYTLVPVADVPTGIAIRDADPSRVKLFVDGFEVPALLVGGRAIIFAGISSERRFDDGMDFAYGGAAGGGLEIDTQSASHRWATAQLNPLDASLVSSDLHSLYGGTIVVGARYSFLEARRGHDLDLVTANQHVDVQGRQDWRPSSHWQLAVTFFGMFNSDRSFGRDTLTARYHDGGWSALLAVSSLYDSYAGSTFDTRADVRRDLRKIAGLDGIELRAGANASVIDRAPANQFNGGAWTSLVAVLPGHIIALGGARLEMFDTEVALSPRGTIAALFGHIGIGVTASAYRQPQVDRDATPERATEVTAIVQHRWPRSRISVTGYYVDRSRIEIENHASGVASAGGVGRATGVGTATGIELRESIFSAHWTTYVAASFSQATRADRSTAPDHPADLDVPVRVDALLAWHDRGWRIGARVQLRSGLPYTPVTGSIYDGDTDTYTALYGTPNSERAPVRRELDLRVDRQLLPRLHAYIDLAFNGGVVGYTESFDFSQQLAVRAPAVIPWAGIVGTL